MEQDCLMMQGWRIFLRILRNDRINNFLVHLIEPGIIRVGF